MSEQMPWRQASCILSSRPHELRCLISLQLWTTSESNAKTGRTTTVPLRPTGRRTEPEVREWAHVRPQLPLVNARGHVILPKKSRIAARYRRPINQPISGTWEFCNGQWRSEEETGTKTPCFWTRHLSE